jgi:hypothetical protein
MKLRTLVMAGATLLLLCGPAVAQQGRGSAGLLLRFQKTTTSMETDPTGGGQVRSYDPQSLTVHYSSDSTCLLVYQDGTYYYEKMSERTRGKTTIKAFQGTLQPADLEQLQSVTAQPAFRDISSPAVPTQPDDATYLKEGEILTVTLPRPGRAQLFTLVKKRYATKDSHNGMGALVSNWSGLEKTLKPFLSWVKNVEKASKAVTTDSRSSSCPAAASVY